VENRLSGFLVSACLHLAAAALLLLAPGDGDRPAPAGGIAVSGYVTLGKPGTAPGEARQERAAEGGGPASSGNAPPPPPKAAASPASPPPPETRASSSPPEPRTPPAPAEAVKSAPESPRNDPSAVPIPENPEKMKPRTPEPPKTPPKTEPPKKTEVPKKPEVPEVPKKPEAQKKPEVPKKPEPANKPPASSKPRKDDLSGALAELSREVSGKNTRRDGGAGGQNQGGNRALSGALAELGKEAKGRGDGASGSGPGGDGGDGYGVLGAYQDSVISRVRPNWSLPARADRRSYTAVVNIKIAKDGTILEARIIRSSGNGFFDASVMQAVTATKALEPPPHPDYSDINISFTPEALGRQR
jgi:colicin import membrane protein